MLDGGAALQYKLLCDAKTMSRSHLRSGCLLISSQNLEVH